MIYLLFLLVKNVFLSMYEGNISYIILDFDPSTFSLQIEYCRLQNLKEIFKRTSKRRLVN